MLRTYLILLAVVFLPLNSLAQSAAAGWTHLSTASGDLLPPNAGKEQTALLVADLDKDGVNDFVITERTQGPAVVWYRKAGKTWNRFVLESGPLRIEAGGASHDIDGDGDLDIIFGGDGGSNGVWWWENPYPNYNASTPWKRYTIKSSGANKHHDQLVGDFNGDGKFDLVMWNQRAQQLLFATIPENAKTVSAWNLVPIYQYSADSEMTQRGEYPQWKHVNEHEGLARIDVDGDGTDDIVAGGRWFKHTGEGRFQENIVDASYTFTRSLAGQFISGGRPEIILAAGDGTAPLILYQWEKGTWKPTVLLDKLIDGHSIGVVDYNGDGHLDIFSAEMGLGNSDNPKTRVLLGDGQGDFETVELLSGFGMHESQLVDLDGDGDLDILGKPYTWKAPRIDIWINTSR
jgi:hypothetical protein